MAVLRALAVAMIVLAGAAAPAAGYAVGAAVPLDELATKADLVCKATVVSVQPVVDPWFDAVHGYEAREAELRVISIVKGATKAKVVRFRHYARVHGVGVAGYAPQTYDLVVGRSYLVFAASDGAGGYRQVWKSHTVKEDQGLLLTATARRHRGATIGKVVWAELTDLVASKRTADVLEGIRQLDELSGGHRTQLADYPRKSVLAAIRPLIRSRDAAIATSAIGVFGSDSPYFDEQQAPYWLAGLGQGSIAGLSALALPAHPTADLAKPQLVAVATGKGPAELRALAIRALGRSRVLKAAQVTAWAHDPDPALRRAAVLVSAELLDRSAIKAGTIDAVPEVRRAAALAVGFAQDPALVPALATLLADAAPKVRATAAMALLSFAIDQVAPVMKASLATSEFKPLFVNALARKDPAPYLGQLAEVIEKQLSPSTFWGGRIPAGESWELLFGYVKARPAAELASGKLDRMLDALERMRWYSSSEPRMLYALYLARGLAPRAKRFRAATRKAVTYDIDFYFDMADKDPSAYLR